MNEGMTLLERAIAMATSAHAGQKRKDDSEYILHPLRVMFAVQRTSPEGQAMTMEMMAAAVLHDVVEDTGVSLYEIAVATSHTVAFIVDGVTRRSTETYKQFIDRAGTSPFSRHVKIQDLLDNLQGVDDVAPGLRRRYEEALIQLGYWFRCSRFNHLHTHEERELCNRSLAIGG